jgi:arsenate reductase-like glutaredoxin family protein
MDIESAYATGEATPESYAEYASWYYGKKNEHLDDIQTAIDDLANELATMMANKVMCLKNIHVQQQKAKLQQEAALFDTLLRQIEVIRKPILDTKTKSDSVWNKEAHRKKMKERFAY